MWFGVNRARSVGFNDKVLHRNEFKNWLDFQFSADFLLKCRCASLRFAHKFFQKKKKKKRKPIVQVEGFKKASFLKKILPDASMELRASCLSKMFFWNCMGGDFFKNPEGLNLLFWIPATYLCSLFFIFYFVTDCRLSKMFSGKGIKFWGRKKWKPVLYLCFFWTEIWYSFFSWFCVCFKCR